MIEKIEALLLEIDQLAVSGSEELETLRVKYLSKKGIIPSLMDEFRTIPAEQKREVGVKINELKQKATDKIKLLKDQFESTDTGNNDIDLTRTSYPVALGTRHPISIVKEEINDIFKRLGFSIAEGPEVEDDWHVFSSLNFADDTLHAICRIHFLFRTILRYSYVRIHRRCRQGLWKMHSLQFA